MRMTKTEYLNSFDELNTLTRRSVSLIEQGEFDDDDFIDFALTMLITAYENGYNTTSEMTKVSGGDIDLSKIEEALNKEYDGKTYEDLLREYLADTDKYSEEIERVMTTEYHRLFNAGGMDRAEELETEGYEIRKVWETMQDGKVRGTHSYLQSDAVPLDSEFFTYDGDSALYPGAFSKAENNIGCRCWLEYSNT